MTQRWKIRKFPDIKEKYGDDETVFMPKPKKKKKIALDILAILHRKDLMKAYKEYTKERKIKERTEDQRLAIFFLYIYNFFKGWINVCTSFFVLALAITILAIS